MQYIVTMQRITWQYNSSLTAASVGDSIYDENDKLVLVGNEKGSITAIKVSDNYVEKEERINLDSAFPGPISSLRIMDWNGDNVSETWVLAGDGIHMLEGKSQVERIVGTVEFEGEIAMVFNDSEHGTNFEQSRRLVMTLLSASH